MSYSNLTQKVKFFFISICGKFLHVGKSQKSLMLKIEPPYSPEKISEIILFTHVPHQPHDTVQFTIKTSADAKTLSEKVEIANVPIINSRHIINRPPFEIVVSEMYTQDFVLNR